MAGDEPTRPPPQAQQKYYEREIEHLPREIPNDRTIVVTNADSRLFH